MGWVGSNARSMLCLVLVAMLGAFAGAETTKSFHSSPEPMALIELFSSEGCSSCPPAEKQLYALREKSDLGKKFCAINFHVDNWNQLGWVDRFSNEKFTLRQKGYSQAWGQNRIFTPEFVFNGTDAGVSLPQIGNSVGKPGVLSLDIMKFRKIRAQFRPLEKTTQEFQLHWAVLGNGLESVVKAGENKGETLRHNFVALQLDSEKLPQQKKSEAYQAEFPIPEIKSEAKTQSIVAWITEVGSTKPLQAVCGDL
jgi:hypothetical protein